VLRQNFIAMNAYSKISEKSQRNNLMIHLKFLEKQEQAEPKSTRWEEIIKNIILLLMK
jgi:hypothetical protein